MYVCTNALLRLPLRNHLNVLEWSPNLSKQPAVNQRDGMDSERHTTWPLPCSIQIEIQQIGLLQACMPLVHNEQHRGYRLEKKAFVPDKNFVDGDTKAASQALLNVFPPLFSFISKITFCFLLSSRKYSQWICCAHSDIYYLSNCGTFQWYQPYTKGSHHGHSLRAISQYCESKIGAAREHTKTIPVIAQWIQVFSIFNIFLCNKSSFNLSVTAIKSRVKHIPIRMAFAGTVHKGRVQTLNKDSMVLHTSSSYLGKLHVPSSPTKKFSDTLPAHIQYHALKGSAPIHNRPVPVSSPLSREAVTLSESWWSPTSTFFSCKTVYPSRIAQFASKPCEKVARFFI